MNIVIGFAILFGIMALGIHIASAMFIMGVSVGFLTIGKAVINTFGNQVWNVLNNFVMTSVPLYLLLGELLMRSGVTETMYNCLSFWLGRLPGGLLHTNIAACALLAANSGSSVATAATIGVVAVPALIERGYDKRVLLGSIAASGTLGILIPPSINMIIYASIVGTSVGHLFLGGFIPGFALAFLFMLNIVLMATINPSIQGTPAPQVPFFYKVRALISLIPIFFIVLAIMGTIYMGWATPTEAAALGVLAVVIVCAYNHKLTIKILNESLAATLRTTAMILLIMVTAFYLNYVVSILGAPQAISNWFVALKISPKLTMYIIVIFYLFLGCFIETIAMMVTTLPLVVPVVIAAGYSPLWFGIFLMILCEASLITPPVGMNLYVVQGIRPDKGPMSDIFIGTFPFLGMMFFMLILLIYFPEIALWLPNQIIQK
jgi:C4-dicarboxylate transporter DctM subunit